jgi:arylsulfatase A-like enzyme
MAVRRYWPTLLLCMGLGLLLLALSAVRIVGDAGSAAFGGPVIEAAVDGPLMGTALGKNLVYFAAALIFVHITFALICWLLAVLSKKAYPSSPHSERTWLLLWFTLGTGWILVANAALFPWSSLGSVYFGYVRAQWMGLDVFRTYTSTLAVGLFFLAAKFAVTLRPFNRAGLIRLQVPALGLSCGALVSVGLSIQTEHASSQKLSQPHVIIVGIDSLRADAVETGEQKTPGLDKFLSSAIRFTDATTPLARTFPSWVSIITGRNPHSTGATINLLPRPLINPGETLPELLAKSHYTSIYAIDEVRFSNLDTSYGFNRMISPPIGATDFVVGFFGDTPLSNLLANTWAGGLFFPNLHANRAAAHVYDPDTFIEKLDRELEFNRPTFLAVHLTLPHWPYSWADAPHEFQGAKDETPQRFYDAAVTRADQQFNDLMLMLRRKGALENAIVVVISDHGESLGSIDSLGEPNDPSIGVIYKEEHLLGHGTSVFSPHQYQVLLAMKSYGNALIPNSAARIAAPVSLEDLTPTVLELLNAHSSSAFDGVSLVPLLQCEAQDSSFASRVRFTETEFNPPGFVPGAIPSANAMSKAAAYYRVDPRSDRVVVRAELLEEMMEQRQFAALKGTKMLAAVPIQARDGQTRRAFLVKGTQRPVLVSNPEYSTDADVRYLWDALTKRYPLVKGLPSSYHVRAQPAKATHHVPRTAARENGPILDGFISAAAATSISPH